MGLIGLYMRQFCAFYAAYIKDFSYICSAFIAPISLHEELCLTAP